MMTAAEVERADLVAALERERFGDPADRAAESWTAARRPAPVYELAGRVRLRLLAAAVDEAREARP